MHDAHILHGSPIFRLFAMSIRSLHLSGQLISISRLAAQPTYLDPRDLNQAIQRSHYPLPTLEDVATRLTDARVFSVLDAKSGFWQIKLDEESSYLTTFNTPFGRFRWKRCPFGISSAPEEWQYRAHTIVEGLHGVEVIADDFLALDTAKALKMPEPTMITT